MVAQSNIYSSRDIDAKFFSTQTWGQFKNVTSPDKVTKSLPYLISGKSEGLIISMGMSLVHLMPTHKRISIIEVSGIPENVRIGTFFSRDGTGKKFYRDFLRDGKLIFSRRRTEKLKRLVPLTSNIQLNSV